MQVTVGTMLDKKGHDVWSVTPHASVYEALELMAEKNIGAVLVLEGDNVIGIFSERDHARRVALKDRSLKQTRIREVMSSPVCYITPSRTIDECMALMTEKRVRHLPVFQNDKLIGMITIGDVVKAIIAEQQYVINELESYVDSVFKKRG